MRSHLIQSGINLFRACLMTCCFVWFSVFSGPVDLKDWFFFLLWSESEKSNTWRVHTRVNQRSNSRCPSMHLSSCCIMERHWKKCWCHDNKKLKLKLAIWKLADINAQRCKCWEKNVRGVPSDNQIDRIRCQIFP